MIKKYFSLLIFPILSIIFLGLVVADNQHVLGNQDAVMYKYIQSARQGQVGYGFNSYYANDISFAGIEPGDLILGGYPGCAYGRFSHAGIYIGDGKVLESFGDLGVNVQSIEHYRSYREICLLRVKADPEIKKRTVDYAIKQQGAIFYPLAFKNDERYWNCSKIIWKAYRDQGIELDPENDLWVAPDIFYKNDIVEVIREKRV
ncbi:MAG: YiiX/YebB-like N1pC/P60 family cysteine hydrolase [Syntrophomonadaceae bacterium]